MLAVFLSFPSLRCREYLPTYPYLSHCRRGFGTGLAFSALFIAVQAAVDKTHIAPAVSMLYLSQGFGIVVGIAAASAAFQAGLRSTLDGRLGQLHLAPTLRDEVGTAPPPTTSNPLLSTLL